MNMRSALAFVLLGLTSLLAAPPARADSAGIDALLRAQKTADQQTSYRIRTTNTDASGTDYIFSVEFVKPDRYHMQSSNRRGGGESIVVGKDTYMRQGAGAWRKLKMDLNPQISGARLTQEALASSTVTQIGPSSLNGVPMMVYAMTYAKDNVKSTGKIWVGTADNLLRLASSDLELPVTKMGGKSFGGKSHSLTVWEYNLKLEIKAPM